jgi:hypothetical protein
MRAVRRGRLSERSRVSIPFIAGQWSLPGGQLARPCARAAAGLFQSPSLRGSGRFIARSPRPPRRRAGFNPLHCGAVVASWRPPREPSSRLGGGGCFNPLHCGAVVASSVAVRSRAGRAGRAEFQSPSLRGSGRFGMAREPMHRAIARRVSIPFIAGQWSLLADARRRF